MLLYGNLKLLNHSAKQTFCGACRQTVCEFAGLSVYYLRENMLEQHGSHRWGKKFLTHNDIVLCMCALGNTVCVTRPVQVSVSISELLLSSTNHLLSWQLNQIRTKGAKREVGGAR